MNQMFLKKIRVTFAVIYFILISLLFLDLSGYFAKYFSDYLLYFQFVPSLLGFVHSITIASTGFILILLLTALFGRVYCSFICPLGILIDIVNRISLKIQKWKTGRKKRFKYLKDFEFSRYLTLKGAILLYIIFGVPTLIVLFDPYSVFGRFITNFAKPVVTIVNNTLVYIFELFGNYSIAPHKIAEPLFSVLLFPVLFLILILFLTYKYGRLYCNLICPVGALLGAVSKISLFKIKVDESNCTSCGLCGMACKASCIDTKNHKVDFSRCVACYDCIDVCNTNGIKYSLGISKPINEKPFEITDETKRNFLKTSALMLTGSMLVQDNPKDIKTYKASTVPENKTAPISPPGSQSIEHFLKHCTACTLCVSACPTDVLKPSTFEYGLEGFLMPRMNNWTGFCNYECTICGDVCPNEAILPLKLEDKKLTQIGKVKFNEDNCIVHAENTSCGACSEHCPTQAVHMVPYGKITKPEINDKICIGCGACEYACPTRPYRAIYVDGNPVHKAAEAPKQEKLKDTNIEDFPF